MYSIYRLVQNYQEPIINRFKFINKGDMLIIYTYRLAKFWVLLINNISVFDTGLFWQCWQWRYAFWAEEEFWNKTNIRLGLRAKDKYSCLVKARTYPWNHPELAEAEPNPVAWTPRPFLNELLYNKNSTFNTWLNDYVIKGNNHLIPISRGLGKSIKLGWSNWLNKESEKSIE